MSDEHCNKCDKLVLKPNVAYGINPDAVCHCGVDVFAMGEELRMWKKKFEVMREIALKHYHNLKIDDFNDDGIFESRTMRTLEEKHIDEELERRMKQ